MAILNTIVALIQIPREVPHPDNNTPLDISDPADIIIYIVVPLIFLILYLVMRKKRSKKKESDESNK